VRYCAPQIGTKEQTMPEVVIYALGGRSLDQKRGLMKDVTDAVVKNFKVEPGAVVVTLVESEKQDKMKGGVLFSEAAPHR
jgi:4-oxalocrotonate tautomerase